MFVFWFKNGNNDPKRASFDKYYIPLVEIKDFNALIDNKPFFVQLVKEQTRSARKAYQNVKKWWLWSRKFIRLFVSSKAI